MMSSIVGLNVNDLNYECNLQLAPQNNGTQCTSYKNMNTMMSGVIRISLSVLCFSK